MMHLSSIAGRFLGVFIAFTALATSAKAQHDVGIDAFFGTWQGTAISKSEVSIHFRLTTRDIGVMIQPVDEKSFKMTWSTVQRQSGNPEEPTEVLKSTTVTFVSKDGSNIWWSTDNGNARNGEALRWARIDGNALILNSFVVRKDGSSELQTYRRSLTDAGMELNFTRTLDGELVRTAEGRLVKVAR